MSASPTEHQDTSSVQTNLTEADEDSALAQDDARNPAEVCLAAGVVMGARSSTFPRPGRRAVIAGANIDGRVGTLLAAAPIIAKARAGSATPGLAPAIGDNIEGALA